MAKIQIKSGLQSAVSGLVLAEGELAVALDTAKIYVGTNTGTVVINHTAKDVPSKVSQLQNDSNYQTAAQVASAISALVASAPETLDTLKEIAAALGNDPKFATTITTAPAAKEPLIKNAAAKATLADAGTILIMDRGASNTSKKITGMQLKAYLKTYNGTLYNKYALPTASATVLGGAKIGSGLIVSGGIALVEDIDGGTF